MCSNASGSRNGKCRNGGACRMASFYVIGRAKSLIAMGWTPPHLIGIEVPDWRCCPPVNREKKSTMKLIRVGVDLAKNVFQVHGVDRNEKAVWRRKLTRENWH